MNTPIEQLNQFSREWEVDLRAKRDDLLPVSGGGNKVRKVEALLTSPEYAEATALITVGGVQSNHARVVALLAARKSMRCHVVLHGPAGDLNREGGNLLLMRLAGATIEVVPVSKISVRLQQVREELEEEGEVVRVIPGGAHAPEAAAAYAVAVDEVAEQVAGWVPDVIIHASGTGGTQAGLLSGCERRDWATRVVGVSIARAKIRGGAAVADLYQATRRRIGLSGEPRQVEFRDEWVGGGYGMADGRVSKVIRAAAKMEGLILDPTYTGKAFLALQDLVVDGSIPRGSRVLFWHTGGLLNLMSSDVSALAMPRMS